MVCSMLIFLHLCWFPRFCRRVQRQHGAEDVAALAERDDGGCAIEDAGFHRLDFAQVGIDGVEGDGLCRATSWLEDDVRVFAIAAGFPRAFDGEDARVTGDLRAPAEGRAEAGDDLGNRVAVESHLAKKRYLDAGFADRLLRPDFFRRCARHRDGHAGGVDAHVPQRAAAQVGVQADVGRVFRRQVEAEPTGDELHLADFALAQHRLDGACLRVVEVHKRLEDGDPFACAAASIWSSSASVGTSGFSQRTCFPAAMAFIVHSKCSVLGSEM